MLEPQGLDQICKNLNGLQAQFQPYVDEGFRSRMGRAAYQEEGWRDRLTRQWSLRGTMHAYLKEDIPLYIHKV